MADRDNSMEMSDPVTFEAVIVPHRSLGRRGFRWLAALLLGLTLLVSLVMFLAGAWPVIGFAGLEVTLALFLLRRHALAPFGSEIVILTEGALRVIRTDPRGSREERTLPPAWLRVDVQERPGRVPALLVRGARSVVEIGTVLGEEEKRALAAALRDALHRQRNPVFDNPQLREISSRLDPST